MTLLTSGIEGATDTNQKWLHSGLLYPSGRLAERAWSNRNLDWKIKRPYIRGPEQAYILALTDKTISQRSEMWSSWSADSREVPEAQPLQVSDRKKLASLGVRFKGGWKTPDCVLDFPALVRDMRLNISGRLRQNAHLPAPKVMGTVMEGATVLRLRRGTTGIAGVDYEWKGGRGTLLCDQCVLSAGAWSYELLRNIDTDLPLIRKKCLVMAFKPTGRGPTRGVSFDRITVWLDVQKEDGTRADFTIVPFDRRLLAAGTDFRVVYQVGECALENLRAGPSEIAALQREMEQCFVDQRRRPFDSKAFRRTDMFQDGAVQFCAS